MTVCHEWGGGDQLSHSHCPSIYHWAKHFPSWFDWSTAMYRPLCGVFYKPNWSQISMKKQSLLKPSYLVFEVLSSLFRLKPLWSTSYFISTRLLINAIYMHFFTETKALKCFQIQYSNECKFLRVQMKCILFIDCISRLVRIKWDIVAF